MIPSIGPGSAPLSCSAFWTFLICSVPPFAWSEPLFPLVPADLLGLSVPELPWLMPGCALPEDGGIGVPALGCGVDGLGGAADGLGGDVDGLGGAADGLGGAADGLGCGVDRKSTRLNYSHLGNSYAVFCL